MSEVPGVGPSAMKSMFEMDWVGGTGNSSGVHKSNERKAHESSHTIYYIYIYSHLMSNAQSSFHPGDGCGLGVNTIQ